MPLPDPIKHPQDTGTPLWGTANGTADGIVWKACIVNGGPDGIRVYGLREMPDNRWSFEWIVDVASESGLDDLLAKLRSWGGADCVPPGGGVEDPIKSIKGIGPDSDPRRASEPQSCTLGQEAECLQDLETLYPPPS